MKNRLTRWIILLVIGFAIGSAIGYFQGKNEQKNNIIELSPDSTNNAQTQASAQEPTKTKTKGKTFTLIDHNGKQVTQDKYADSYKLMFFGFTFCPAVCPTELQKVNLIMDELGELANNITPIFVSIDPERDTPEVMKEYVAQFHPKLVGLTGSMEQIEAVKKTYNVYAKKVENDMMEEYMMDHSTFLYFMSPDNNLIALYPAKDSAEKIAKDIKSRIN